ncbi:MAG TPA: hypothetical protein PLU72_07925 [Candidatus Ozemobacteraceae bacterium]|nr:hypothetical protein [Candidatus Ozemobacteraceae bacterium]HQG28904.1 hypothetical protein [Candidatus Ozemobacteraceae bacterium]
MKKILTVVLGVFLCSTLFGATLDEGVAAHQRGDYQTAAKILRELAEDGDVLAQFILGGMYSDGKGMAQDHGEAFFWLTLASRRASTADLQTFIGKCLDITSAKLTQDKRDEIQTRCTKWEEEFAKKHPACPADVHQHEDGHQHNE